MRMYYEATTSIAGMWYGNPVLTCVIFGLPLGFLSLICYSIFCSDLMDAGEDEPSNYYSFLFNQPYCDGSHVHFFFSFTKLSWFLLFLTKKKQMFVRRRTKCGGGGGGGLVVSLFL